eukprot:3220739-Prymnesium_polylepis.3
MRLAVASLTSDGGARHPYLHAAELVLDDHTAPCAVAPDLHAMRMIPLDCRILWCLEDRGMLYPTRKSVARGHTHALTCNCHRSNHQRGSSYAPTGPVVAC